jgi:quercetin dioxygenase-like cupin family protein
MYRTLLLLFGSVAVSAAAPPPETVSPAFSYEIPNIPGKTILAAVVDYPPAGASPAHRHPRSAFIVAYVLSGEIRSAVDGEPARIYRSGESWVERPGAHHTVSENVSASTPARLLAVFIMNSGASKLVVPDQHNHAGASNDEEM